MTLPKQYSWLAKEAGPRILAEGLKTYGTSEKPGPGSNPTILQWAKVIGYDRIYKDDATAWCGLWMGYTTLQAGWDAPLNLLGARNWLTFGRPSDAPMLGDVLVFWRGSKTGWSGHVGLYAGEDRDAYHVLGGNQSDRVSFSRIAKTRLLGARRCPWRINQPANVRPVWLSSSGALSTNEA